MKVLAKTFFILILAFTLAACSRSVPKPAAVYVANQKDRIAAGYMVGRTVYMKVNKATGAGQHLQGKGLVVKFLLGDEYELYLYGHPLLLTSQGEYRYRLDYKSVNRAELTMLNKNGLNVKYVFAGQNHGIFFAKPNNPKIKGTLQGSFVVKRGS